MVKVKLTVGERFMASRILNEEAVGIGFDALKTSLKIADKIVVDEKERKDVNFKIDEKTGSANWNESKTEKDIEFNQDEHKLLISFIDSRNEKKQFSIKEGSFMISLIDKLKEAKDE